MALMFVMAVELNVAHHESQACCIAYHSVNVMKCIKKVIHYHHNDGTLLFDHIWNVWINNILYLL
jgi:hypothetical protein